MVAVGLALIAAGCGNGVGENGGVVNDEPQTAEGAQAGQVCEVDERFCTIQDRFWVVRSAVYGPPFTESPEEIEAMLAESDALLAEWKRLAPDEIRPQLEFTLSGFAHPIDAITERLGWDPYAAMNTEEARAIFADVELNAASEEVDAYVERCCPLDENLAHPSEPVIFGDRTIAVYNGTPALNEALSWGLERYAMAGLEVPPIGSATFTVQSKMCDDIRARYLPTARGVELELCMDERTACWENPPEADPEVCEGHCPAHVPGVLAIVLHEIAHAWLDANLATIDTEGFLEHAGLEAWRDRDLAWDENGVEHAADTIAWGLMDRDIEMLRLGQPTAEELTRGFRLLTGTDPLPKADPETAVD